MEATPNFWFFIQIILVFLKNFDFSNVQGNPPQTVLFQTVIFPSYLTFTDAKNMFLYAQGYEVL